MPHDLMTRCEQKKEYRRPHGDVWEWVEVAVSTTAGVAPERLRCMHCHGAVKVNRQNAENGPRNHVVHLLRLDSEHCVGGVYYDGKGQRPSTQPV